ncbi:voltage-dependent T-type calcium channel subunit alpha-1G-like [Ctenocephalides felis]|uniref:voltage-dependent T-type calcium channel subunit alpha-1G-like n=1 Tax=Ctenocephalides felis TaxID=7515 RepID=UPI000E6E2896|nr:voltage-dependent T-type calcium channel subunit alpha-1G-like [Ctenocephalides felis]
MSSACQYRAPDSPMGSEDGSRYGTSVSGSSDGSGGSSEGSSTGTSSEGSLDLPYPGFAPVALRYLTQDSRPRSWCLKLITNPYPFSNINKF